MDICRQILYKDRRAIIKTGMQTDRHAAKQAGRLTNRQVDPNAYSIPLRALSGISEPGIRNLASRCRHPLARLSLPVFISFALTF